MSAFLRAIAMLTVATAVIVVGYGTSRVLTEAVFPEEAVADPVTPPSPGGQARPESGDPIRCQQAMASFDEYPLVWLGEEFEGLPLAGCERVRTNGTSYGIPPTDYFFVYYGSCTPPDGADSCPIPLQVSIEPGCSEPLAGGAVATETDIRGAAAFELSDGAVQIDALAYKVTISSGFGEAGRSQILRATEALEGRNSLASALTSDHSLNDLSRLEPGAKAAC